jgi:hypothetical protein
MAYGFFLLEEFYSINFFSLSSAANDSLKPIGILFGI